MRRDYAGRVFRGSLLLCLAVHGTAFIQPGGAIYGVGQHYGHRITSKAAPPLPQGE